jgi:Ca2+-binding RTX toxin-like protein
MQNIAAGSAAYQNWQTTLTVLERFNGRTFNAVPAGSDAVTVNLWNTTQDLLQQSYQTLKTTIYQSLVLQTRLAPYLDQVGMTITDAGVALDFAGVAQSLSAKMASEPAAGFFDLVDFTAATRGMWAEGAWDGWKRIGDILAHGPVTAAAREILAEAGWLVEGLSGWSAFGSAGDDLQLGEETSESISGGSGADRILGLGGSDNLSGGDGNDTLWGGTGNDNLYGNSGDDVLEGGCGHIDDGGERFGAHTQLKNRTLAANQYSWRSAA